MFENPRKNPNIKQGDRLLIDFDQIKAPKTNKNDINIEREKLKEDIKKPTIRINPPKKGKSLF